MKHLTDPVKIVEVLGGPQKVAEMTLAKSAKVVWNWYGYFGLFPADTHAVMTKELKKRGYAAPPYLWKQKGFERAA